MKNVYLLLLVFGLLLSAATGHAQAVTGYTFSTGTGATAQDMSGATTLLGPNVAITSSAVSNIGFPFPFGGVSYTQFSVNTNGELRFGSTVITNGIDFPNAGGTDTPGLSAESGPWRTGTDGGVKSLLVGSSPNRTLVVDWSMSLATGPSDRRFQVWLSEGSGAVRFVYSNSYTHNSAGYGCGAGIATAPGTYQCLNLADDPFTSTTASVPEVARCSMTPGSFALLTPPPPPPTITGINPTSGGVGTSVTVSGTNLGSATGVAVNGTAGTITANTATSLTFTVRTGSTTGPVSVTTAGGTATGPTFTVAAAAPAVTSVAVPASATYGIGQNLNFTVNFNQAVTVNTGGGTPSLSLTVGSTARTAGYVSGSGTAALVFRYTVPSGDLDANGLVLYALALNGGTIRSSGGTNANLTLYGVGSTSGVLVDGVAPTVAISSSAGASGSSTPTAPIPFSLSFSESVSGLAIGDIAVTNGTKSALSGSGAGPYTFTVTPTTPGSVTVNIAAGVAQDAGSNGNIAATPFSITYAPPPTITGFTPASGPVGTTVTVTGTNLGSVSAVTVNGTAGTLTGTPSATSFTFTVGAGSSTGVIGVTTAGGSVSSSGTFTVATLATVTTTAPSSVTPGGAVVGGSVASTSTVTERGVAYVAGSGPPTTSNTKALIGSGTGSFSGGLSGLTSNTLYSVRAYAITSAGTAYGATQTFTTANNPPVANDDSYTVNEDSGPTSFNVRSNDTDPDAGTTLTITAVTQPTGGTATFTGTGVSFAPTLKFTGTTTFTYTISDGNGGSDTGTVSVSVTAVNDAPVVTVPAAQSTPEDTSKPFGTAGGNALSVSDVDVGSGKLEITLTVASGTLTLSTTTGLTFTTGTGSGNATMKFQGTPASVNTALNGLSFTPNANFTGTTTLTLAANDLGNTGTGGALTDSDVVSITVSPVNDPPVVTTSGGSTAYTVGAGAVALDNALTVTDSDNATLASGTVSLTTGFVSGQDVLSFTNTSSSTFGNITASYAAGTGVLTLTSNSATATLAQWQAALRAVGYTNTAFPPSGSSRTATFRVTDGGSQSAAATKNVTLSVPAPTVTALSAAAELPGMPITVTGTGFTSGSSVTFGGVAAGSVTYTSATSLTATVPAGAAAGSAAVVVSTPYGNSGSTAPAFAVLAVYSGGTLDACAAAVAATATTGDGQWHYLLSTGGQVVLAYQYSGPSLGSLAVDVLRADPAQPVRQDGRGRPYLDRNWHLTASGGTFTGRTVQLRLYGLSSELTRLQAADASLTAAGLRATQYSGAREDCQFGNNDFATGEFRSLTAPATTPAGASFFTSELTVADHFSELYLSGGSRPLPVELVAFTAEARHPGAVALAWRTASEKNSAVFEVERSTTGQAFERIGTVMARGTSSSATAYAFLDAEARRSSLGQTSLFYRLRQVDADGTFSYSPVRVVALADSPAGEILLWPNPARAALTVAGLSAAAPVMVLDALGRVVATATADATGTAHLTLPDGLPAGLYVVSSGARAKRLMVE